MRLLSWKLVLTLLFTTLVFTPVQAQNAAADVVLVLPFENTSKASDGAPRGEYNWVGESFADALA
ncbi:MAG TPA: hypothetical protein VK868_04840, partial [Pyrinomonadaceae bacterium]|nr:hypothetical protein [Pyrinomonadaceae bacterium]